MICCKIVDIIASYLKRNSTDSTEQKQKEPVASGNRSSSTVQQQSIHRKGEDYATEKTEDEFDTNSVIPSSNSSSSTSQHSLLLSKHGDQQKSNSQVIDKVSTGVNTPSIINTNTRTRIKNVLVELFNKKTTTFNPTTNQQQTKEASSTSPTLNHPSDSISDKNHPDHPLGLSVTYLNSNEFQQDLQHAGIDFSTAKIYDMEPDLKSSNFGLLRSKGQHITCPRDHRLGAAYVDSIEAEYVGPANVMLSYTWGYAIKDVVDSLVAKCQKDKRDPNNTFVWICCFCNNQHRIGESKVSFEEFRLTFYGTVTSIKTVWSLMAPWNKPGYLERIWCIFEIFTASTTDGCRSEIIMPPREREAMLKALVGDDAYDKDLGGFQSLVKALGNTKIENADASVKEDLDNILQLVRNDIGYTKLNAKVNGLLREWVVDEIKEEDKKMSLMCEDATQDDLTYSIFCGKAGSILRSLGILEGPGGAIRYYKKALSIKEKVLDKESPDLATSYRNMGLVLADKGNLDGALEYMKKAVSINEKMLNKESPSLAASYNDIGLVLADKGDLDGALEYTKKALYIDEKVLDKESPDLATSYSNMGSLLADKGDLDGALEYYNKALSIEEKMLDKESPSLATSYSNIGLALKAKGDLEGALEYYKKALSIDEKVLDKESPNLAISYNNMGSLFADKGDLDGALEYYNKALAIQEKVLDKESPSLASSYSNIGMTLKAKGDLDGALEYLMKTLSIKEKVLDKESPSLATSYNNIGQVLKAKCDLDGALEYHQKALAIREKVLDKESPDLASSYNSIGGILDAKGDLDEALEYHEKAFWIKEKILYG